MKKLQTILNQIPYLQLIGNDNSSISSITIHSKEVIAHSLFIATIGTKVDSHNFIPQAILQGAKAIICETLPTELQNDITYIQVANTQIIVGIVASNFYHHPSQKLKVVGITGTNGKTTCATLLYQLFTNLNYTCGLISTVQNKIGIQNVESTHTTPNAIALQKLFTQMLEAGCTYVFMEVSSHAVHQHRIAGIHFAGGVFTNITHEHLDYHKTFDEYIRVKKKFFDHLSASSFAITNIDDKRGAVLLQNTLAKKCTYSLKTLADYKGKILENNLSGLIMNVNTNEVHFRMIGEFNGYNLLAVYACAIELGQDKNQVLTVLSILQGAEGRFDYLVSNKQKVMGIVDYAHTPDALKNVLATINKLKKGNELLYTVFGCGGDRDKTKRPLMGRVACQKSDKVIFTSDNPRTEVPTDILKEIEAGVPVHQKKKYITIENRREAIKTACSMAQQGDIILVAGKGHEKYQEVNGVKTQFNDKQVLQEMFELYEK